MVTKKLKYINITKKQKTKKWIYMKDSVWGARIIFGVILHLHIFKTNLIQKFVISGLKCDAIIGSKLELITTFRLSHKTYCEISVKMLWM